MYTCVQKILFITDDFRFLSHSKFIIPCSYRAPLSHLTSCTPTKSDLYLANSLAVSQPPLGWLKVRCCAEVTGISEENKNLFLSSIFGHRLATGYFVVVKGRGWEQSQFSWWVRGSWFVTRYFGLLYEKLSLVWLGSLWGRLLPRFPRGATLIPGICQGGKTDLVFERFSISISVLYFGILGTNQPSIVYWYIDELMRVGYREKLEASHILGLCSLY